MDKDDALRLELKLLRCNEQLVDALRLEFKLLRYLQRTRFARRRERMARVNNMLIAVTVNRRYNNELISGAKPKLEAIVQDITDGWSVSRRAAFEALHKYGRPEWPVMVAHKKRRTSRRSAAKR